MELRLGSGSHWPWPTVQTHKWPLLSLFGVFCSILLIIAIASMTVATISIIIIVVIVIITMIIGNIIMSIVIIINTYSFLLSDPTPETTGTRVLGVEGCSSRCGEGSGNSKMVSPRCG